MAVVRRRNKGDIIGQILTRLQEPARTTHLMYGLNLSYYQAKQYIALLEGGRIIERMNDGMWTLTQKGREALQLSIAREELNERIDGLVRGQYPSKEVIDEYQPKG